MTETPESRTEPTAAAVDRRTANSSARDDRPSRLNRIAALVGIVAGVVFIVAALFFSGFVLGAHSGGDFDRDHRGDGFGMMDRDGGPPIGPGGMTGPDQMRPGGTMGPGQMGPGQMGPGQQQRPSMTQTVPSSPRPWQDRALFFL